MGIRNVKMSGIRILQARLWDFFLVWGMWEIVYLLTVRGIRLFRQTRGSLGEKCIRDRIHGNSGIKGGLSRSLKMILQLIRCCILSTRGRRGRITSSLMSDLSSRISRQCLQIRVESSWLSPARVGRTDD